MAGSQLKFQAQLDQPMHDVIFWLRLNAERAVCERKLEMIRTAKLKAKRK